MKISILIPTIKERERQFFTLSKKLETQASKIIKDSDQVMILSRHDDKEVSIGAKRNLLLDKAIGDYCCFLDDDDDISDNYIEWMLKAAESGCDCASLMGIITFDGTGDSLFEHSLRYKEYKTVQGANEYQIRYERYPNHLNLIKTSIAKQFKFPEINHGEDTDWATQIRDSGLLKTEFHIPEVIYYYKYVTKK
jgi:glycosyltransferase involved in cell wall biosynthesis